MFNGIKPLNLEGYKLDIISSSDYTVKDVWKPYRRLNAICPVCDNGILMNYYYSKSRRRIMCNVCESKVKGSAITLLSDIGMYMITRTPKGMKTPHLLFKEKMDAIKCIVSIRDIGREPYYRKFVSELIEDNSVTYAHLEGDMLHYYPGENLYKRIEDIRKRKGKYLIGALEKDVYGLEVKHLHRRKQNIKDNI